jgi:hypothetical protein
MAGEDERDKNPGTPAEQYEALRKEFHAAAHGLHKATTDEECAKVVALVERLSPRCLELAERHANDPVALDALVQVVTQEIWLQNNTTYPGRGKDSLEATAIALLLRDHVRSDRLAEATRRVAYGFSRDCENFLRTVLASNPPPGYPGTGLPAPGSVSERPFAEARPAPRTAGIGQALSRPVRPTRP